MKTNKKQISKTRQELFDNTINYFNIDNLSYSFGSCFYRKNEKACAIGREIKDELAFKLDNFSGGYGVCDVFNLLPKRLQKMGIEFLSSIQDLHDNTNNWTSDGLSETGKNSAQEIAEEFNLKFKR